ncbi:hypothetical protein E3P86_02574 [Wallemia ichthyophaga]|uniref:F-box domain-containing protein n=1 Tax=Wallemia ichthyophaga TaxID=245174 RepID=A0A4T0J3X9_WALIC|nr:hypothetical protein E3P86_02574 [Wallemia ichthyophaga]
MVDTQPASLHSLPAELLDMVLILQPQLAKTCKYLYNLNLKNDFAMVRGPGCKIRGVSHYTFSETPVKLIGGFNGQLKRMTILPCADYVRKLYVNMHNTKSGKMGSYINTLANHVCAFTNLHQLTVTLSSLYHILAMKNIVMENISTLVLECRSFYLEDSEPDDVVDLLLTSFPNLEKVLLYAGNDFRGSAEKLKKVFSEKMPASRYLQYAVILYRSWSNVSLTSTMVYLNEYIRVGGGGREHGNLKYTRTALAPICTPNLLKVSPTISRVLEKMAVSHDITQLHHITIGYE